MTITERLEKAVQEARSAPLVLQDEIASWVLRRLGKDIDPESRAIPSQQDKMTTGRQLLDAMQAAPDQEFEFPAGEPLPISEFKW